MKKSFASIRTDLALEAIQSHKQRLDGIEIEEENGEISISRVSITSRSAEKKLNKAMGQYITIDAPELRNREIKYEEKVSEIFAGELRRLLVNIEKKAPVMVVGLGNDNVTADSLGPGVVEKTMVTRHIFEFLPEEIDERMRPVCALSPGVLGVTGVESAEFVKGICQRVKPAAILAIDSLVCRQANRISSTVQLSNTGLAPGAGVGNKRLALNQKTMGVPVIAIGIPMVVYAYSIAHDALELLWGKLDKDQEEVESIEDIASGIVEAVAGELVVTPKEIDAIIDDAARVLADGINMALHDSIALEEVRRYMN